MKLCLLTHHPHIYTHRRLTDECAKVGLGLSVPSIKQSCWVWPNSQTPFDLTFNRLSAVESGAFERALSILPLWGRQVNPWELRQQLWDKAHQAVWLGKLGLSSPPSFMHQGPLSSVHAEWESFAQDHRSKLGWVMKFNRGQKGHGVNFVADDQALFSWLETVYRMGDQDFLVQPRLAVLSEYRLTFLDGKLWALLQREGEKANHAQGGKAGPAAGNVSPFDCRQIFM